MGKKKIVVDEDIDPSLVERSSAGVPGKEVNTISEGGWL